MLSSTRTTGESWSTRCAPGMHSCLSEKLRQRLHAPPAHPPPDFQTTAHAAPPVPRPLQAYINSKISTAKGRKMPIAHCCEYPTVFEIVEVLKHLGYENPLIEVRPRASQRCLRLHTSALVGRAAVSRRGSPPCRHRTRRILGATSRSGAVCACSSRTRSQASRRSRTSRHVRRHRSSPQRAALRPSAQTSGVADPCRRLAPLQARS